MTIALEWGQADILETILAVPPAQLDLGVPDLYGDNVGQIAVESSEVQCSPLSLVELQRGLVLIGRELQSDAHASNLMP